MADVQLEHGYTRIANRLLTAIALARWDSPAQPAVVLALVRMSYGLRRKDAPVGLADWRRLTGLPDATLRRAMAALENNGVIRCVREQDSATMTPKVWRLEKRFTHWKRFAVAASLVEDAERVAAEGLSRSPLPMRDPGVTGEQWSPMTPGSPVSTAPGSPVIPPSPTPVSRGSAPEPAPVLDEVPPKERERQERQKNPPAPTARACDDDPRSQDSLGGGSTDLPLHQRVKGGPELAAWLGTEGAESLDRFIEAHSSNGRAVDSIRATYAEESLAGRTVWGALQPGGRPPVLADALESYGAEGKQYHADLFRKFVIRRVDTRKPHGERTSRGSGGQGGGQHPSRAATKPRGRGINERYDRGTGTAGPVGGAHA